MADAVEASGQHVEEKAPDELVRREPHRLPAVRTVDAVVFPAEGDAGVVGRDEAAVRDGDPVGVAGQIGEHCFGPANGALAVDDPLDAPQRGEEALERGLVGEPGVRVEEVNRPASCASASIASILPLNRRASRLTARRSRTEQATHRDPSSDSPPPGTIMCTCG